MLRLHREDLLYDRSSIKLNNSQISDCEHFWVQEGSSCIPISISKTTNYILVYFVNESHKLARNDLIMYSLNIQVSAFVLVLIERLLSLNHFINRTYDEYIKNFQWISNARWADTNSLTSLHLHWLRHLHMYAACLQCVTAPIQPQTHVWRAG